VRDVLEVLGVLVAASALGYAIRRFYPDSREGFGAEVDDALYRGSVRAGWAFAGVAVVVVLLLWLLI
jgi:hypothetical protein